MQTAGGWGPNLRVSTDYGRTCTTVGPSMLCTDVGMSADGKVQAASTWGNLYVSTDSGKTWTAKVAGSWYGVAVSADGRTIAAGMNAGQIHISNDSGETWTTTGPTLGWFDVAVSANGKLMTAVAAGQQIYVSSDGGATWLPRDSSRGWFQVAMSADGKVQTALVGGWGASSGYLYVSTDFGETWTQRASNKAWFALTMSSDGKIQTASVFDGQLYTSTDYGETWTARDSSRYWWGVAMSADGKIQTAVEYYGALYTSIAGTDILGDLTVEGKKVALADGSEPLTGNLRLNGNYVSSDGDDEGLYVADDGKIGIGTTTPDVELTVKGGIKVVDENGNYKVGIWPTSGIVMNGPVLSLWSGSSIRGINGDMLLENWSNPAGEKGFAFRCWSGSAYETKVRIDHEGKLGIGTTTPAEKLEVDGNVKASGTGRFEQGITYVAPLGDISMGDFNQE